MELTQTKKLISIRKGALLYILLGFLLGIAPLAKGVYPFGVALLCAMPRKFRKEVFVGVLISTLFDKSFIISLFCSAFVYFVIAFKEKNGKVYLYTRFLLALAVSSLKSAYIVLSGITDMTSVFSLLATVVAYPAFTYAFSGFFDKKRQIRPKFYDISLLAFAFAFTLILKDFYFLEISLSLIPAAAFTLIASRTMGFAQGGVCGIACGLAGGGGITGALGVLGMTYGMLAAELEPFALILSFLLGICGYYYLVGSFGIIAFTLLLALIYTVFVPLRKHLPLHHQAAVNAQKRETDKRISRYAAAFSSLSSLFYTVSETTKTQGVEDMNKCIVASVENYCNHCEGCQLDHNDISNFFTTEMRRSGVVAYARIPSYISTRCPNVYSMARDVNNLPLSRVREGEAGLKKMADEYSAFSTLLVDAAKKQEENSRLDKSAALEIKNALSEIGIECDGVRVCGSRKRDITVFGVDPEKIKESPNKISKLTANIIGTAISYPELVIHDDYVLMKMTSVPALKIECAKISEAKSGETVCGDTVSVFENQDRYYYCLVSDGMGSGRDAALTSRLSAIMMEKLLSVGAEKESALRLLNKALVEKEEEIFATVDLLEIDRILQTATLIKVGGAPTLIIRNGKSVKLESKTPPAGIMRKVIADKKTFRLEKGDMIVMLSDGILQTGSDFPLLASSGLPPMPSARALASKIFKEAQRNRDCSDDMSVCVLRIH